MNAGELLGRARDHLFLQCAARAYRQHCRRQSRCARHLARARSSGKRCGRLLGTPLWQSRFRCHLCSDSSHRPRRCCRCRLRRQSRVGSAEAPTDTARSAAEAPRRARRGPVPSLAFSHPAEATDEEVVRSQDSQLCPELGLFFQVLENMDFTAGRPPVAQDARAGRRGAARRRL